MDTEVPILNKYLYVNCNIMENGEQHWLLNSMYESIDAMHSPVL